jgi:hypothetical protein
LCVSVCLVYSLFYGRKHRPCEALNAAADPGKPFSQPGAASAKFRLTVKAIGLAKKKSVERVGFERAFP